MKKGLTIYRTVEKEVWELTMYRVAAQLTGGVVSRICRPRATGAFRFAKLSRAGVFALVAWLPACGRVVQEAPRSSEDCVTESPYECVEPAMLGLDADELEDLTRDLQRRVERGKLMGAELLVVKDARVAWHVAVGWSDVERGKPLERNSVYRMRSMTKPFIGAAVLMLVEEGRLNLDDRVAAHLDSFGNGRSNIITIRQALSHSSGFEQVDFPEGYWEASSLREAIRIVGEVGPPNPPGEEYRYSDYNTAILGAIVAEVTGEPVEEWIRTRILGVLGLHDTHMDFAPDSLWMPRMNSTYFLESDGFRRYWDPSMPQSNEWFRASGGMYSTTLDYARWLEMWIEGGTLDGHRVLDASLVDEALQPAKLETYGYHWELYGSIPDGETVPAFGHSGTDGTFAIASRDSGTMVLIFTQSRGAWDELGRPIQRAYRLVGL